MQGDAFCHTPRPAARRPRAERRALLAPPVVHAHGRTGLDGANVDDPAVAQGGGVSIAARPTLYITWHPGTPGGDWYARNADGARRARASAAGAGHERRRGGRFSRRMLNVGVLHYNSAAISKARRVLARGGSEADDLAATTWRRCLTRAERVREDCNAATRWLKHATPAGDALGSCVLACTSPASTEKNTSLPPRRPATRPRAWTWRRRRRAQTRR